MKKINLVIVLFLILLTSCNKNELSQTNATEQDKINEFIWDGMRTYYLWQEDVPTLNDKRFSTYSDLYLHFRNYSTHQGAFESLLYQKGVTDRFSWIEKDYVTLENSFQGINTSTGMEFSLVRYKDLRTNVFGYVRYVIPNSNAETNNVTRGMLFSTVDGTQITESNLRDLLFGDNTSLTIGLADYNNGNPSANGTSFTLNKTELQENPIAITKVLQEGSKKVGYLLYNQFASSFDTQLNAAFANFKSQGVTDLIVDLRYNGGGSVRTATRLGAMITGQYGGELFSKQIWNQKVLDANDADQFLNKFPSTIDNQPINSLGLTNVYFIVSGSSASASELVINGLKAYINVKLIGTKTYGKHVGSITLYDSDNLRKDGANLNPSHRWAMQPIVLEIQNKKGENEPNGFVPEALLGEDISNLGVLGERSDPLLARALKYITTGSPNARISNYSINTISFDEISNSKQESPMGNNMYVEFDFE
ncbi:C-terminal processing protease CtpA/Prc [Lutibacter sp. Hel_I_33_5]|uniref:S41 family peptidase n=1 Tax=Lutibacter sp. Hel_I_33_5 TaxID=1566289 RepID=UPI00119CEC51|nr:S41 family peptidase [Lutibacter sp. Hel_I_33_5]TVZ54933.1 C-terminal processing protease CtpA/Prc [Lutibacter sp. Hel_I_33_5]